MNASGPTRSNPLRRHPGRTLLAVLAAALLLLILLWDWNWLKGPISSVVKAKTGREFVIGGDLDVDLGRRTTVSMQQVRFANATWSKQGDMFEGRQVNLTFDLWPALFGHGWHVSELDLEAPRLRLEVGPDGKGNWDLGGGGNSTDIQNLWVNDGRMQYQDSKSRTDIDIGVRSRQARRAGVPPLADIAGKGHWKGNPLDLQGTLESPLELRNTAQPYRINVKLAAGPTRAHARGTLLDPFHLRDFDLKLAISGQNMDDLYRLIGLVLPPSPPYSVDGRLTRKVNSATSSTWQYDDFSGKVGNSDLAGLLHFTTGKRNAMRADFRSKRLDIDDLAGFIGSAPADTGKDRDQTNAEFQALKARQDASPRLLPDTPYALEKLRAMDADVRLRAGRVNANTLPLDDMDAHLLLKNGVMTLDPLNFGVADGDLRSTIRMDASTSPVRTRADVTARRMTLSKLMPTVELGKTAVGKVGGRMDLSMQGNSIAAMAATADGDLAFGMGRGQISKLLMKYAGLDLAGILKIKLTGDQQIPIRCAFADFKVDNGVMHTRSFVFDTESTLLNGSGTIDLKQEQLDLTVRPHPRGFSPLSLRSPLYARGTFKHPDVKPDYARIALRGLGAAALGSIAAPAALLATTDLGDAKDTGCATGVK